MHRFRNFMLGLALALFAPAANLLACATCRPDPNDPIAHAADMSVVFLGGMVMTIVGGIFSFFGYLYYRGKHPLLDPAQLIAEASGEIGVDHESLPHRA